MASLDITPQKPLRRAYERDPQAVEQWRKETYPKLRRRAKRMGARIFFLDEAGFQSDPPLGRTYGLKGKTPVVTTSGQRQSINVISAVNARGEFWAATYPGKLDAEAFVAFLKNFLSGRTGQVFLVVDGHPAHKANRVKGLVKSRKGRLELHYPHFEQVQAVAWLQEVDPVVESLMRIGLAGINKVEVVEKGLSADGLMGIEVVAQQGGLQ